MKITLKALRINSKLTLEEASKKIGISRETLRSYEAFKTAPDLKMLPKIFMIFVCISKLVATKKGKRDGTTLLAQSDSPFFTAGRLLLEKINKPKCKN